MSRASTYFRILRWIFALLVFTYLWREGGYWRYVSYIGFVIAGIVAVLLLVVFRSRQR